MWLLMPSPEKTKVEEFQVQGHPGLHSETPHLKTEIYSTVL